MHIIQQKLLELSKRENLAKMSLREMAKKIDLPEESPQKIKHHITQIQKKGFLTIDKTKGVMKRTSGKPEWSKGLLKNKLNLFSIPILGTANCGPADIFAEQNFEGFLKISSKLIGRSKPNGLYAIKAEGYSMNRATINNKSIEDGDFVIVDGENKNISNRDIVLVIIDNKATIKRFTNDENNSQIILKADSSYDYAPIYLHPEDDFFINGKVINIIKK